MRKAQGALEYLIIIAAVLAIAAIVVLFLTGAFKGATGGGDIAKCKLAASTCANKIATGIYATSTSCNVPCIGACANAAGKDVMATGISLVGVTTCPASSTACLACVAGAPASIYSA